MITRQEIENNYRKLGALGAEYLGRWKGYDVYDAIYPEGTWVGGLQIVLVKGDEVKRPGFHEAFVIDREVREGINKEE